MKILSFGATGSQGGPVARRLLERGHGVRTLLRNPEKAEGLRGLEVVGGDLGDAAKVREVTEGAEAVFMVLPLGGNPLEYAGNVISAAKGAGVKLIVLNTSGQTPREPTGMPMMDYRIALEAMLRESGIPGVILRPTAYMENFLGPWVLPGIQHAGVVAYPHRADYPVSWIASDDVAKLAVAAFERPELAGQSFDVGGPEALIGGRIAESFTGALGRRIRYEAITPQAFGERMGQVFGPEMGAGAARAYQISWDDNANGMAIEMNPVLDKLPVKLTPLEEWVRQHAPAFAESAVESR